MLNERRILLALFSIAFGARVLYTALAGMDPSVNPNPITPEVNYGFKIASGTEWLTDPYSPRAPGYPIFLGTIFLITGEHIWPAIIMQAILGGLLVILVFKIGKSLGGWGVGILSAIWVAFYVHHIYFSSLLIRDVFAAFVLVALVYVLSLPFKKMRYSLLAGGLYAALIHIDPQYLILLPVFAAFIVIFMARYLLINVQYLMLFLSFVIAISIPWTVRNYFVYKQFVPVSLESSHFFSPIKEKVPAKIRAVAESKSPPLSESRLDRMKGNAVEFWRVAKLRGTRQDGGKPPIVSQKPWSLRHNVISIASYGLLLPFFLVGLFSSFFRRNRTGILLAAVTIAYFFMRLFLGGSERTRLQVEPFIILLAFLAIFELRTLFQKPDAEPVS